MTKLALSLPGFQNAVSSPAKTQYQDLGSLLSGGYSILLLIAAFLMVYWLSWGIFQYIFAGGEKEKLAHARKRITWAIVGFIIIVLAFTIRYFVEEVFPPQNTLTQVDTPLNYVSTDLQQPPTAVQQPQTGGTGGQADGTGGQAGTNGQQNPSQHSPILPNAPGGPAQQDQITTNIPETCQQYVSAHGSAIADIQGYNLSFNVPNYGILNVAMKSRGIYLTDDTPVTTAQSQREQTKNAFFQVIKQQYLRNFAYDLVKRRKREADLGVDPKNQSFDINHNFNNTDEIKTEFSKLDNSYKSTFNGGEPDSIGCSFNPDPGTALYYPAPLYNCTKNTQLDNGMIEIIADGVASDYKNSTVAERYDWANKVEDYKFGNLNYTLPYYFTDFIANPSSTNGASSGAAKACYVTGFVHNPQLDNLNRQANFSEFGCYELAVTGPGNSAIPLENGNLNQQVQDYENSVASHQPGGTSTIKATLPNDDKAFKYVEGAPGQTVDASGQIIIGAVGEPLYAQGTGNVVKKLFHYDYDTSKIIWNDPTSYYVIPNIQTDPNNPSWNPIIDKIGQGLGLNAVEITALKLSMIHHAMYFTPQEAPYLKISVVDPAEVKEKIPLSIDSSYGEVDPKSFHRNNLLVEKLKIDDPTLHGHEPQLKPYPVSPTPVIMFETGVAVR